MIQLPATAAFDHLFTCFSNPFKRLPWSTELLQGNLYKARELTCKKRKEMQQNVQTPDSPTLHKQVNVFCLHSFKSRLCDKCDRHIKETKESRLPIVTGFAAKAVLFSYSIFRTFTLIQHFYDFIISS